MQPLNYTMYQRILQQGYPSRPVPAPFPGKYPTKMVLGQWKPGAREPYSFYFGAPSIRAWEMHGRDWMKGGPGESFAMAEVDRRHVVGVVNTLGRGELAPTRREVSELLDGWQADVNIWLWRIYHPGAVDRLFLWMREKWEVRSLATGLGPMRFYIPEATVKKGDGWQKEYRKQFGEDKEYERALARAQGNPWIPAVGAADGLPNNQQPMTLQDLWQVERAVEAAQPAQAPPRGLTNGAVMGFNRLHPIGEEI